MEKIKILAIEDDPAIIQALKDILPFYDIECEILHNGKEALRRLEEIKEGKKEKPKLILLDLLLPDVNGFEILKEIKRDEKTKDIKVFVLTNYYKEDLNEELQKEGADKILLKVNYTLDEVARLIKENI